MKKHLILLLSVLFSSMTFAQVGINTETPNAKTLLHISEQNKTTDPVESKGIIIPRLTDVQRDAIAPGVTENSMLVYNTVEDCYNYWNNAEQEWKSLCGKLGKSQFTFDCAAVEIKGTYVEGRELTASNYLSIPVTVTKPGEYTITATTENGYSFYTSGTFLNTGTYTVQLSAQGTAVNVGLDDLTITTNGTEATCSPAKQVEVLTAAGTYTIGCKDIKVNGIYKVGGALGTSNTITLPVTVASIGSWSMSTNTVDGISYSGSGTFSATGVQYITLSGTGTPTSTSMKSMTLTHNSDGLQNSSCNFNVRVVIPKKRILGIGEGTNYGYNISNNRPSRTLLTTANNYGTMDASVVAYEGWSEIIDGTNNPSAALLNNWLLGTNPVDIVVIGYSFNMNQAQADIFLQYLIKGGVIIAHTEGASGNQIMLRTIFNDPTLLQRETTSTGDGRTYTLPIFNDPIVNGPFGDLRGKVWGDDATHVVYFTNLPSGDIVQYSNAMDANNNTGSVANSVTAFRHKTFNFVWVGEGGFTSQAGNPGEMVDPYICPFKLDANGYPIAKTNYFKPVYNSVFFANTIAWALEQAEHNGINTQ